MSWMLVSSFWGLSLHLTSLKYFTYGFLEKQQINIPVQKKMFLCINCTKCYRNRSKLNRHIRYECGGARKRLECKVCKRKFSRPDNLKTHEVIHTMYLEQLIL